MFSPWVATADVRKKKAPRGAAPHEPRDGVCFAYLLLEDEPEVLPGLLPAAPLLLLVPVLPPPALVPPLMDVPALPMPLEPARLLDPLWPVLP